MGFGVLGAWVCFNSLIFKAFRKGFEPKIIFYLLISQSSRPLEKALSPKLFFIF